MQKSECTLMAYCILCTLEGFKVLLVGICEPSHGPIIELLHKAHLLSPLQQPLPRGPHDKYVGVPLLIAQVLLGQLIHQQVSPFQRTVNRLIMNISIKVQDKHSIKWVKKTNASDTIHAVMATIHPTEIRTLWLHSALD